MEKVDENIQDATTMEDEDKDKDNSKRKVDFKPKQKRGKKKSRLNSNVLNMIPLTEFDRFDSEYTSMVSKDGLSLRVVKPYIYEFKTTTKGRWKGRAISDVFSVEFGTYPPSYYIACIESGRITVNENYVTPDYCLQQGDVIVHKTHRHEPPVKQEKIEIVYQDEEYLIVNKPATIPVHPCGAYRYNSLVHILQQEVYHFRLFLVHRLDRLTSGLTILCKNSEKAKRVSEAIASRNVQKIYLARVKGNFANFSLVDFNRDIASRAQECMFRNLNDSNDLMGTKLPNEKNLFAEKEVQNESRNLDCTKSSNVHLQQKTTTSFESLFIQEANTDANIINYLETAGGISVIKTTPSPIKGKSFIISAPIVALSFKEGKYAVGFSYCGNEGKTAQTQIEYLWSMADGTSIVCCRPITGRTHQIRLHLQYLGYPIANDPNYGENFDPYHVLFMDGITKEENKCTLSKSLASENPINLLNTLPIRGEKEEVLSISYERKEDETDEEFIGRLCPFCILERGEENLNLTNKHIVGSHKGFRPDALNHQGIYLHAWRYESLKKQNNMVIEKDPIDFVLKPTTLMETTLTNTSGEQFTTDNSTSTDIESTFIKQIEGKEDKDFAFDFSTALPPWAVEGRV